MNRWGRRLREWKLLACFVALTSAGPGGSVLAYNPDGRGSEVLGWQSASIARVVSFTPYGSPGKVTEVAGRSCFTGYQFHLDVLDNLAFDIDETVDLLLRVDMATSAKRIRIEYDSNAGTPQLQTIALPERGDDRFGDVRVPLPRARFAGRSEFATDIRIAAEGEGANVPRSEKPSVTVCDVEVQRSHTSAVPREHGWLSLRINDEGGDRSPARVSIVDETGRMPLPDTAAVEVRDFANFGRTVLLPAGTVNWPGENRYAFYVDGEYRTRLPVGAYRLVVTKGIEYRYAQLDFQVRSNATVDLDVNMVRWIDMPARGWMSGDVHAHMPRRDAAENRALLLQAGAEDVHVANTLVMGNVAGTYFPQTYWGADGVSTLGRHHLVAGQEDPRTAVRGHTVHLNMARAARDSERYLVYRDVFDAVHAQGGVSGYAHLDRLGSRVGMTLDVPLGLVSFLEVLQRGEINTEPWFDFLNLGYRIAPAAGSDVPYGARLGDVRSYVKVREPGGVREWMAGLAAGTTFATNGPMIEFTINAASMGEALVLGRGEPVKVAVSVSMNPDVDVLDRVELIEQGDVIRTVVSDGTTDHIEFTHEMRARHGTWFVVRAFGRKQGNLLGNVAAVSAPIYLSVNGERTWKQQEVAAIAQRLLAELDAFYQQPLQDAGHLDEWFETEAEWRRRWSQQKAQLQPQIALVKEALEALQREAGRAAK
ncbi:CehA/McbA family metallohydrolase [Povalibacter sp.]|uniref:CehA/McbA family metallohydrolase n=1 Tax=Povalibacter sp. TaxID=1962978 RepID=UPI002F42634E